MSLSALAPCPTWSHEEVGCEVQIVGIIRRCFYDDFFFFF